MLEKIIKLTNDFQEKYDAELAKFKAESARIQKTYKETSQEYLDMKVKARNEFNTVIEAERQKVIDEIRACAVQDRDALADITSKPAPSDAVTTIELLKAGDHEQTSEFEVKSILEKYKENYLATKMIVQVTNAKKRFGIMCTPADSIIKDIQEVEEMACRMVRQYNGNLSYEQAVLLNGKIVMHVNEQVQNFLNYKYCETLSETMRKAMNA